MQTQFLLKPALARRERVASFLKSHRIGVLAMLFTDIVDSTKLKQELGDLQAVSLIQQHHAELRALLKRFSEAEEIETAGDSFFFVFTKPSDATKFALLWQARLRKVCHEGGFMIQDRIGLHVGEVLIETESAAGGRDLYGIQVDTTARIMSLAVAGQILLSRFAFDNARQLLKGQDSEELTSLSWVNHGSYLMKGVEDPIEVCEVGETATAPLVGPRDSEKAQRNVAGNHDMVLGWRPSVGDVVPETEWVLDEKLGEGAFGEVWLAVHRTLKQRCVFKFCFRADRVRSLKREVTLFRILRERTGNHPNVVVVEDVYLEKAPFYLVTEYVAGRDLVTWSGKKGGVAAIPLATRLEIVAQVASGLQAAHDAGVLHRDVKPSNILIDETAGEVRAKLCDFGVGQVVSEETFANVTRLGFTETALPSASSAPGTHLYMAPELFAGKPSSISSDIYALGVVLYQFVTGDWSKPLTMDWIKNVDDPLLREDLIRCFAGNPSNRFQSASGLANQLRSIDARRRIERDNALQAQAIIKRAYLFTLLRKVGVSAIAAALLVSVFFLVRDARAGRYGTMEIRSFPEGAEVWHKGKMLGLTPFAINQSLPGEFDLSLKLLNYQTVQTKVLVAKRERARHLIFMPTNFPTLAAATNLPSHPITNTIETVQIKATSDKIATVLSIEGKVQVKALGTNIWRDAHAGMRLSPGDTLRTGKSSRATISSDDYGILRINELTTLTMQAPKNADLKNGSLYFFDRNSTNGVPVNIRTPTGRASIRG